VAVTASPQAALLLALSWHLWHCCQQGQRAHQLPAGLQYQQGQVVALYPHWLLAAELLEDRLVYLQQQQTSWLCLKQQRDCMASHLATAL
jgi:hypothetical protein